MVPVVVVHMLLHSLENLLIKSIHIQRHTCILPFSCEAIVCYFLDVYHCARSLAWTW